ncbi:ABC transporter permease [Gangjinia marincola]|uniref:ABC transporter permease n=1 Tax=Gangjinia marincola TaxID=578463 RepID=A0ABP3XPT7_9FLAO
MNKLPLIIKREFKARVRNRTFVVMTFVSPLIFVGMIMLIAFLSNLNKGDQKVVAVYDENDRFYVFLEETDEVRYIDLSNIELEDAKNTVRESEYYALLYIPRDSLEKRLAGKIEFFVDETPNASILNKIERAIGNELTNQQLIESGVDLSKIESSQTNVDLIIETFSGEKTSKLSGYIKMGFGAAAGYLLFMFIIIYGNMVMRSVIEEKTNRIIEIIISSVKPVQLMMGKVLGTSLAGLTQFAIWAILILILLFVSSAVLGIDIQGQSPQQQVVEEAIAQSKIELVFADIARLPLTTLFITFFIYFFCGFFLYSSIYAAIGAAVDNETDTQQFMLPVLIPLILGIYVGFFSVVENPHGTVSTIFSFIPLTSPVVMLMRIPFGVALWEILLSISILIITIFGVVWFAAKIYRVGILMYGKKPSYKELYKWLKY